MCPRAQRTRYARCATLGLLAESFATLASQHGGIMVTDPVAFTIGPLAVRWYGILIMIGVLAGSYLAARLARRKWENPDHLWNMVPLVVFSAIAGARIYWVWLDWNTCCAADPWQALNIRGGGISIHG